MQGARKKRWSWLFVVFLCGTAVFTSCAPPPQTEMTSTVSLTAVPSPTPTQSPTQTPTNQPKLPTPAPLLSTPTLHPLGSLLFSSRRIDTNGDGLLQPPDGIHIYEMNLNSHKLTQLTNGDAYNTDPVWSPNGTQIIFVSTRSGNVDLFVMNADGSDVQQLTDTGERVRHPTWSPDGNQIAFSGGDFISPSIFIVDVVSGDFQQLTQTTAADAQPDWSDNGRFLTFTRTFPNNVTQAEGVEEGVHLFDLENNTLITPTRLMPDESHHQQFAQPQWVPGHDLTLAMLQENRTGTVLRLFELNTDALTLTPLPIRIENVVDYAWTDDSTLISTINQREATDLTMLKIDLNESGTFDAVKDETAVSLTNDDYIESNPNWHP